MAKYGGVGSKRINILIQTLFNSKGVNRAKKTLTNMSKGQSQKMQRAFVNPMNDFINRSEKAKQSLQNVGDFTNMGKQADKAGLKIRRVGQNMEFVDKKTRKTVSDMEGMRRIQQVQPKKPPTFDQQMKQASKTMKTQSQFESMQRHAKGTGLQLKKTNDQLKFFNARGQEIPLNQGLQKTQKRMDRVRNSFDMAYLSIMFFGMAIQRMFSRVIKAGIGTYKKMTENNTEASQALTHLSANVKMLKFTLGQAIAQSLMPYAGTLIDIIQRVAEFIKQNKGLTAGILTFGTILGASMMIIGQFGLALGAMGVKLSAIIAYFKTLGATSVATGTIFGNVMSGMLRAAKAVAAPIMKVFSRMFSSMGLGMTKFSKYTRNRLARLSGSFIGFAAIGGVVGKILYEGVSWGIAKLNRVGGKDLGTFFKTIREMVVDLADDLGSFFTRVGNFMSSLASGDIAGLIMSGSKLHDLFTGGGELKGFAETEQEIVKNEKRALNTRNNMYKLQQRLLKLDKLRNDEQISMNKYLEEKQNIRRSMLGGKATAQQLDDISFEHIKNLNDLRDASIKTSEDVRKKVQYQNSLISASIASVASAGVGFLAGGPLSAAAMGAGAGLGAGHSAFKDIQEAQKKDLSFDPSVNTDQIKNIGKDVNREMSEINSKMVSQENTLSELSKQNLNTSRQQLNVERLKNEERTRAIDLLERQRELTSGEASTEDVIEEMSRYSTEPA